MSAPKIFTIKESTGELKKLCKNSIPLISKRIEALLIFKTHEATGISKRVVASLLGVDPNSIQSWRSLYIEGGIEKLMSHAKIGFKPSVITKEQEQALRGQMHKPDNGFAGFVEFLDWFDTKFGTTTNYKTFHGFVVRKFDAKIKTARKVHLKKDVVKAEEFKKNSLKRVKPSSIKRPTVTGK
jgi:transposase